MSKTFFWPFKWLLELEERAFFLYHYCNGLACDGVNYAKISIFSLLQNIRSLSKNFKEFSHLFCNNDPLVVALTEITNTKLIQIENYQEVFLCTRKKREGVVGIYLKRNPEFDLLTWEISDATQCFTIFVLNTKPQFAFTIVYKPPDSKKIFFIEILNLHLDILPRTKIVHHVVCGDFKIILLKPSFTASWLIEYT